MVNLLKILVLIISFSFLNVSFADNFYDNNDSDDNVSIISKYIDDYMKDGDYLDRNSTELYEKKYSFEFFPYLSLKYTSHELHDDFNNVSNED
jgi:hypothetical protein